MIVLLSFTTLVVATLFALAAGTVFQWLLLKLTLQIMRPAAVRATAPRPELARGTAQLAHAFEHRGKNY